MLFLVPVIAALWPTIRLGINSYNEFVVLRSIELNERIPNTKMSEGTTVQKIQNQLSIVPADLPDVWAIAFLASLCSMLGNVIYQSRAPSLIKDYKLAEFEELELRRYRENPTETQLRAAQKMVDGQKTLNPKTGKWEPTFDITERWENLHSGNFEDGASEMLEREYISLGARERYEAFAYSNIFSSTVASVSYSVSLCCIIWIIVGQAIAVFQQAGWVQVQ